MTAGEEERPIPRRHTSVGVTRRIPHGIGLGLHDSADEPASCGLANHQLAYQVAGKLDRKVAACKLP